MLQILNIYFSFGDFSVLVTYENAFNEQRSIIAKTFLETKPKTVSAV